MSSVFAKDREQDMRVSSLRNMRDTAAAHYCRVPSGRGVAKQSLHRLEQVAGKLLARCLTPRAEWPPHSKLRHASRATKSTRTLRTSSTTSKTSSPRPCH